jgi:predicted SprT family Zn-dependent metalloprotease
VKDLKALEIEARDLMNQHGLQDWKFEWSNNKTGAAGYTNFTSKVITLSKPHAQVHSAAEVDDTIRHEIAHALAGFHAGHGYQWQVLARQLGAKPEATMSPEGPSLRETLAPWVGRCPAGHESEYRYFRKPKTRRSCSVCHPGRFSADHILTYTKEV